MVIDPPLVKSTARRIVDNLPDDATWDEVIYQMYAAQMIEAGLKDAREGRTVSGSDVRWRLGLSEVEQRTGR